MDKNSPSCEIPGLASGGGGDDSAVTSSAALATAHRRTATDAQRPSIPRQRRAVRPVRRRLLTVPHALVLVDLTAFLLAMVVVDTVEWKSLAELVLILALLLKADLYRPRLTLSLLDDAPMLVGLALVGGAASMALGSLGDGTAGTARLETAVAFAVICLGARGVTYAAVRHLRSLRRVRHGTLLLGGGAMAGSLAQTLLDHPEHGLQPVGLLDDDPLLRPDERPVPLLGGYRDLTDVVLEHDIDSVVVTFGSRREPEMVEVLRTCDRLACEIRFVPRFYELQAVSRDTDVVWGIPLVRLRRAAFRTVDWKIKRLVDVVLSAVGLLLLSPVLLVCALLTAWETGTVIFRQVRVGLDERPFTLLKFCSMRPVSESDSTTRWSICDDENLRPIGRTLRRLSLDELPQFWNVLRGDMSLVGPRPERPHFVAEFTEQFPWYMARHRVPAGLTGWAQIHGLRGDTSIADRARFDNYYIDTWSLWGDVKIMLRTVGQVFRLVGR